MTTLFDQPNFSEQTMSGNSFKEFVHGKENNRESQLHLEENESHFNNQCQKVYDLLKQGIKLSVRDAMLKYNITSLPRRILDLRNKGIAIKDEWVNNKVKYKIYYI